MSQRKIDSFDLDICKLTKPSFNTDRWPYTHNIKVATYQSIPMALIYIHNYFIIMEITAAVNSYVAIHLLTINKAPIIKPALICHAGVAC